MKGFSTHLEEQRSWQFESRFKALTEQRHAHMKAQRQDFNGQVEAMQARHLLDLGRIDVVVEVVQVLQDRRSDSECAEESENMLSMASQSTCAASSALSVAHSSSEN